MRRLELGGGALERRVRRPVGRALERRVGDAPVDELGLRRELGADLADAVAQRDHHVEALRDELVEVLGAVAADVDAALAHHAHRVGMQRLRVAAGADGLDRARRHAARAAPRRSATGRCSRCTGTAPAVGDAASVGRGRSAAPARAAEPGCSAPPAALQLLARQAARSIGVVAVAADRPSCGAPTRGRRRAAGAGGTTPGSAARPTSVHQLADGPIAVHELVQQPPPQRVRRQPHERRRVAEPGAAVTVGCHGPRRYRASATDQMRLMDLTKNSASSRPRIAAVEHRVDAVDLRQHREPVGHRHPHVVDDQPLCFGRRVTLRRRADRRLGLESEGVEGRGRCCRARSAQSPWPNTSPMRMVPWLRCIEAYTWAAPNAARVPRRPGEIGVVVRPHGGGQRQAANGRTSSTSVGPTAAASSARDPWLRTPRRAGRGGR